MVFIDFQTKFKSMRFDMRIDSKLYHSIFSFPPYATVFWALHQIIIYSVVIRSQLFTDFHVTNFSPANISLQFTSPCCVAHWISCLWLYSELHLFAILRTELSAWQLSSPLPFPLPFSSFLLPPTLFASFAWFLYFVFAASELVIIHTAVYEEMKQREPSRTQM